MEEQEKLEQTEPSRQKTSKHRQQEAKAKGEMKLT